MMMSSLVLVRPSLVVSFLVLAASNGGNGEAGLLLMLPSWCFPPPEREFGAEPFELMVASIAL